MNSSGRTRIWGKLVIAAIGVAIGFGLALWFQGSFLFTDPGSPGHYDLSLTISDRYLTKQAGSAIEKGTEGRVTHVVFTSTKGDQVNAEGSLNLGITSVPVGMELEPEMTKGTVTVTTNAAHAGPVPIPSAIIQIIVNTMNERIQDIVAKSHYRVIGVGTVDGGVIVYLKGTRVKSGASALATSATTDGASVALNPAAPAALPPSHSVGDNGSSEIAPLRHEVGGLRG